MKVTGLEEQPKRCNLTTLGAGVYIAVEPGCETLSCDIYFRFTDYNGGAVSLSRNGQVVYHSEESLKTWSSYFWTRVNVEEVKVKRL